MSFWKWWAARLIVQSEISKILALNHSSLNSIRTLSETDYRRPSILASKLRTYTRTKCFGFYHDDEQITDSFLSFGALSQYSCICISHDNECRAWIQSIQYYLDLEHSMNEWWVIANVEPHLFICYQFSYPLGIFRIWESNSASSL